MLVRHARLLADLHRRLHGIAAPEWLPAIGPGGAVIHLDLHPDNVMLHGNGALFIDWANARAGHWADDVRAHLPAAIERRLSDPNMTARERELIPLVRV